MKDTFLITLKHELEHAQRRINYHHTEMEKHIVSLAKYKIRKEEIIIDIENLERREQNETGHQDMER